MIYPTNNFKNFQQIFKKQSLQFFIYLKHYLTKMLLAYYTFGHSCSCLLNVQNGFAKLFGMLRGGFCVQLGTQKKITNKTSAHILTYLYFPLFLCIINSIRLLKCFLLILKSCVTFFTPFQIEDMLMEYKIYLYKCKSLSKI